MSTNDRIPLLNLLRFDGFAEEGCARDLQFSKVLIEHKAHALADLIVVINRQDCG